MGVAAGKYIGNMAIQVQIVALPLSPETFPPDQQLVALGYTQRLYLNPTTVTPLFSLFGVAHICHCLNRPQVAADLTSSDLPQKLQALMGWIANRQIDYVGITNPEYLQYYLDSYVELEQIFGQLAGMEDEMKRLSDLFKVHIVLVLHVDESVKVQTYCTEGVAPILHFEVVSEAYYVLLHGSSEGMPLEGSKTAIEQFYSLYLAHSPPVQPAAPEGNSQLQEASPDLTDPPSPVTPPVQFDPLTDPVQFNPHTDPVQFNPPTDPVQFDPPTDPVQFDPHTDPVQFNPHTDPVQSDSPTPPVQSNSPTSSVQFVPFSPAVQPLPSPDPSWQSALELIDTQKKLIQGMVQANSTLQVGAEAMSLLTRARNLAETLQMNGAEYDGIRTQLEQRILASVSDQHAAPPAEENKSRAVPPQSPPAIQKPEWKPSVRPSVPEASPAPVQGKPAVTAPSNSTVPLLKSTNPSACQSCQGTDPTMMYLDGGHSYCRICYNCAVKVTKCPICSREYTAGEQARFKIIAS